MKSGVNIIVVIKYDLMASDKGIQMTNNEMLLKILFIPETNRFLHHVNNYTKITRVYIYIYLYSASDSLDFIDQLIK